MAGGDPNGPPAARLHRSTTPPRRRPARRSPGQCARARRGSDSLYRDRMGGIPSLTRALTGFENATATCRSTSPRTARFPIPDPAGDRARPLHASVLRASAPAPKRSIEVSIFAGTSRGPCSTTSRERGYSNASASFTSIRDPAPPLKASAAYSAGIRTHGAVLASPAWSPASVVRRRSPAAYVPRSPEWRAGAPFTWAACSPSGTRRRPRLAPSFSLRSDLAPASLGPIVKPIGPSASQIATVTPPGCDIHSVVRRRQHERAIPSACRRHVDYGRTKSIRPRCAHVRERGARSVAADDSANAQPLDAGTSK